MDQMIAKPLSAWREEPRPVSHRQALLGALLLLFLALSVGLVSNHFSRRPFSLTTSPTGLFPGDIAPVQVKREMINANDAAIVDARESTSFRRSHLPGALSLPPEKFEGEFPSLRPVLQGRRVVVYCTGPRCPKADILRVKLEDDGLGPVYVMRAGMTGWKDAGYLVEHE